MPQGYTLLLVNYSARGQTITDTAPKTYPISYAVWLAIGVVLFVATLVIARQHQLTGVQLRIFRDFNNLPGGYAQPALWITEGLGAAYPIIACIMVSAAVKRFRLAWRFFVAAGSAGVLLEIGKLIAKEPRPAALLHGNLHLRATENGLTSFPSGHEAMATALALTLWLILPKRWRWVAVVWIIVVGVSRLYLGVHTLTDIVGGFAIGLITVCVLRLLPAVLARPLRLDREDELTEPGF